MAQFKKRDGTPEPFSQIPTRVIRSPYLDAFDVRIFCCISSCGDNAFPGYKALGRWTGFSRDRIWKSLRTLEEHGCIRRYKRGPSVHYRIHWSDEPPPTDSVPIKFNARGFRNTDSTSPYSGLKPVRTADPINTSLKITLKKENPTLSLSEDSDEIPF